jgi:hypothetical protein
MMIFQELRTEREGREFRREREGGGRKEGGGAKFLVKTKKERRRG